MRADAVRNLERILDAARSQIAEHGADVSMSQIASAAGVAVGTLYRHYPTKQDLVRAVLAEFIEGLVTRGERAAQSLTPGRALAAVRDVLADFMTEAGANEAVKRATGIVVADYLTPDLADRGRRALQSILDAARRDGDLRPGVGVDDIFLLMATAPSRLDASARARWLDIVLAGIASPPITT